MKRVLALLVGAGIAVGGAAAWAGTAGAGAGGPNREAAKACLVQARKDAPDADKATLRKAVAACLSAAGVEPRTPTPEQKAKRESVRTCLEAAKSSSSGDKATLRAAAAVCLEGAGVAPGRLRAKVEGAQECLDTVRAANPDAGKKAVRGLVKECVKGK